MIEKPKVEPAGTSWRVLSQGSLSEVWTDGDRILRPLRPWSSAIHELLQWLEQKELELTPRFLESQEGGEILTFLPGEVVKRPWPEAMATSNWLVEVGAWLKHLQDATRDFRLTGSRSFVWGPKTLDEPHDELIPPQHRVARVVSHGDFGPWNLIQTDGKLTGIIDWDLACFGYPLDDLTDAAIELGPLRANREMLPDHLATPENILDRVACLCQGFGAFTPRDLLDYVPIRMETRIRDMEALAKRGQAPFKDLVEDGLTDDLRGDLAHIRATFSSLGV